MLTKDMHRYAVGERVEWMGQEGVCYDKIVRIEEPQEGNQVLYFADGFCINFSQVRPVYRFPEDQIRATAALIGGAPAAMLRELLELREDCADFRRRFVLEAQESPAPPSPSHKESRDGE